MTIRETLAEIRALGCAASFSAEWGREYRVTLPAALEPSRARREAIAYYTPDDRDAVATARAIIAARG